MTIHRFKAETLEDAYQAMRRRLGEDAVVLSTETVTEGGILGFLGRKVVEIRASAPERRPNPRRLTALERRYLAADAADVQAGAADPETVAYFQNLVRQAQTRMRTGRAEASLPHAAPTAQTHESLSTGGGMDPRTAARGPVAGPAHGEMDTKHGQNVSQPARRASDRGTATVAAGSATPPGTERDAGVYSRPRGPQTDRPVTHGTAAVAVAPTDADGGTARHDDQPMVDDDLFRRDIGEMRDMLRVMFTEMPGAGLPSEFVPYYRLLLKRGLTREAASDLIVGTMDCEDPKLLHDRMFFLERLKMRVRKGVKVTGGVALEGGKRKVIALVGPTGVGKTTNIAKLAAQFALKEPAKLGLITADTYRIAATDQLKVYANIIGVDMAIVYNARDVAQALERFRDCDVVLMDTAGGSPFNQRQMEDVRRVLEAAHVDETMLVLSAGTQLEDLQAIVRQYGALSPHSILFTKLDETRHYGALYCLAHEAGLPLSYFSYGQNVPDDVVLAHQSIVAKLVVDGGDSRVRSGRKPA